MPGHSVPNNVAEFGPKAVIRIKFRRDALPQDDLRGAGKVPRSTAIHTLLFDPGPRSVQYRRMEAIGSIVAAYVRLRNRKALDDLRAHRGRLTAELKSLSGPYDASRVIAQLDNEIAIIEAGLSLLDTAAAA
jgi:hypothetical protein